MASIIGREAFATALAEVMPKLAAAAVKMTPKAVADLLGDSHGFGRWGMPVISTALGAALSKIVGATIGDKEMRDAVRDYMMDVRSVFTSEYGQALREAHGEVIEKLPPGSADMVFPPPPQIVLIDPDHPGIGHHPGCTHLKRTIVIKGHPGDENGKGKKPDRTVERQLMSEMRSRLPYTAIAYAGDCAGLFIADAVMLAEQAAKIAKAMPRAAAEKREGSVLGFLGRARAGKIEGVTKDDAEKLAGYVKQLNPTQLSELNEVDSDMELAGLCLADDLAMFVAMMHAAKDRVERSRWAEALNLPPAAAAKVKEEIVAGWKAWRDWSKMTASKIDAARIASVTARNKRRAAAATQQPAPPQLTIMQSLKRLPGRLVRLAIDGTW